jgi:hypothetical protein
MYSGSCKNILVIFQAPKNMKSVVQGLYRLTAAIGNLVDLVVMAAFRKLVPSQKIEFLFFATFMLVDMFLLALLARKYTYKEERHNANEDDEDDNDQVDDYYWQTQQRLPRPVDANVLIAINGARLQVN